MTSPIQAKITGIEGLLDRLIRTPRPQYTCIKPPLFNPSHRISPQYIHLPTLQSIDPLNHPHPR